MKIKMARRVSWDKFQRGEVGFFMAMKFYFKRRELPSRAVRRVCHEHLRQALACLRKSRQPSAVHGVRKEIKKLRAIFRLIRGEIGSGAYRKAAKDLRRATRHLAASRDARVTLQALTRLAGPTAARRFPDIQQGLQQNCRREMRRFRNADSAAEAVRSLRQVNRRVDAFEIKPAAGWAALVPGLRASYRRGRQAYARARRQPSPERLHAWRKQVKNLSYQLQLLCPVWPAPVRGMIAQLSRLGEELGDDHDLLLLQQFAAAASPLNDPQAAAVNRLLSVRRQRLQAAALKRGAQLYAEPPAQVVAQLGKFWTAWHSRVG